jgi:D-alanyl-D-alanine endopeptidase (penicillin-binding protein 7)
MGTHSFDSRGGLFAAKCLLVVIILFSAVRYGSVLASERIIAEGYEGRTEAELMLEELRAERTLRTVGEMKVLEKLHEYEETLATRTIGTASVDTLAKAHEKMIAADLTAMKLYLFENGRATTTFDILSKGKRGSRWETPTGLYKIETKEIDHFSSIGEVHMPYSMQFFGNFFIHGWPYYPNGEPVALGYSGGCIRLSTEDSAKVFEFAARGIPIFVWNGVSENAASSTPQITIGSRPLPRLSADAFLVADVHTGTVYAEKNADKIFPIASLSKLLVALVANETIHYDRTLTVTRDDRIQTEGTPGSIAPNDTFTVGELLYPLIMESNNSAAYTLARYHGHDTFVGWMNDKARAIGMHDTSLDDPSGISAHNVSTANDLFKLTRYIHESQSFILNLSREPKKAIKAENGRPYTFSNFNHFAGNPQFLGGKTGYTNEARQTMTSVWELPVKNATATIAIIILHAEDRKADVEKLVAWFKASAK